MAVRCPVCGEISEDNIAICAMCGFADLNSFFLSQEDYKEWLEHTVKPFSEEYWKQCDKRQEIVDSRNSSESDVKDRENIMSIAGDHDHIVDEKKDETIVSTEINANIKYKYCTGQGDINVQNELENSYSNNKMLESVAKDREDAVSIAKGNHSAAGLKKDGTLMANGYIEDGHCNVESWKDIVSIAGGERIIVGLRKDGTVAAAGNASRGTVPVGDAKGIGYYVLTDVARWKDIVFVVVSGNGRIVGLRKDGTVVSWGKDEISSWKDIVSIACGNVHIVGLKKDGTVVAAGDNEYGQCDVEDWKDIVSIACEPDITVGLRKDGTVVASGDIYGILYENSSLRRQQMKGRKWKDIASIVCGRFCTLGIKKNGTVVATDRYFGTSQGVKRWKNIVSIASGYNYAVGLRKDGTVEAVGHNDDGQCEVGSWDNIVSVACGGTLVGQHTVGLRKDGTVMATGDNKYGQCEVWWWEDIVSIACGYYYTAGLRKNGTVALAGNLERIKD